MGWISAPRRAYSELYVERPGLWHGRQGEGRSPAGGVLRRGGCEDSEVPRAPTEDWHRPSQESREPGNRPPGNAQLTLDKGVKPAQRGREPLRQTSLEGERRRHRNVTPCHRNVTPHIRPDTKGIGILNAKHKTMTLSGKKIFGLQGLAKSS